MYIREHVTMYLPKGHACCRFPCRVVAPFYKLYKVFPFPSSGGAAASRKSENGGESELDTGSAAFEAQCETKDTCFGCKSTRIRLDRPRFMATFSRNFSDAIISNCVRTI